MRRLLLSLLCVILICDVANGQQEGHRRDAFYWNSLIGKGINLGNALEAPEEGEWGVRLKEEYFDFIANAGFNSVRIPVRWSAHAETIPPYSIETAFFARVDWAVQQALSRKLVTIVNIHHYEELITTPKAHRERFLALWKQIAEHYSDYPATLYFEILNEPGRQFTNDLWNEYLGEVIRLIRKSNPTRTIVVGPTPYNSISGLEHLKPPLHEQNIIVTFHYYKPYQFTHQGASWVGQKSNAWLGTKWDGTEEQRNEIITDLDQVARWAEKMQVPLYMGEFGAYKKADMASRVRWTTFLRSEADKRGISWAYWEFCAGFGAYDQDKRAWRDELLDALITRKRAD